MSRFGDIPKSKICQCRYRFKSAPIMTNELSPLNRGHYLQDFVKNSSENQFPRSRLGLQTHTAVYLWSGLLFTPSCEKWSVRKPLRITRKPHFRRLVGIVTPGWRELSGRVAGRITGHPNCLREFFIQVISSPQNDSGDQILE